jgi:hypothetical protein
MEPFESSSRYILGCEILWVCLNVAVNIIIFLNGNTCRDFVDFLFFLMLCYAMQICVYNVIHVNILSEVRMY